MTEGPLVSRCCSIEHDDIQIQGSVQDEDEMEFYFVDSRDSWTYSSHADTGEETSWGVVPCAIATAIIASMLTLDEHISDLPHVL